MDADPEGVAWIEREAVKTNGFDPNDPNEFYTHAIIEVVINASCAHSWHNRDVHLPEYHPRSEEQRWNPPGYDTYVRYKYLTTMYGPDKNNTKRIQKIHGNFNYWQLRNSSVVGYVPVSLPTKEERKMYLDLTFPIRAIYFPLVHSADKEYPTMCIYVRLDFKRKAVKIPYENNDTNKDTIDFMRQYEENQFKGLQEDPGVFGDSEKAQDDERKVGGLDFKPAEQVNSGDGPKAEKLDKFTALCFDQDVTFGLNYAPQCTIEFDVPALITLLAMPRKDRHPDDNPYNFLRALHCLDVRTPGTETKGGNMEDGNYADLQNILKIMQGVKVEYEKSGDNGMFLLDMLNALVGVGLATCVPGIGPLLACFTAMAYDLITNPEKFSADNAADLTGSILGALLDTATEAKGKINFGKVRGYIMNSGDKTVQIKATRKGAEKIFGVKS
ncbi:uncharacterized protein KY384_007309 [Bacidia gigantensis]|uniref:uncharacterized protein n=1 Tax=Bacidia gigantensis TaxID=2732470 RepID=UPI001D054DFA|nr:uncharacterized protein KY384_007309 [Bacidia gigantensis]KAG8528391.1 hypothetical protein KY384_007309 [Bacidia gigantensis]